VAKLKPDKLIARLAKSAGMSERWAVLWGYGGEIVADPLADPETDPDAKVQRLYLDLTRERWMEIPVDEIVEVQELEPGRGTLVWVAAQTSVTNVRVAQAGAFDVAAGFLSGGFWHEADWIEPMHGGPPKTTAGIRCR
jgi:hypothetical protein